MDAHLIVTVAIGSVLTFIAWVCLIAGAEGERLGADIERLVPARDRSAAIRGVTRPGAGPRMRAVADPEYGLMYLAEDEDASWLAARATA